MKKNINIFIIGLLVLIIGGIIFVFVLNNEKNCHESAYWYAYDDSPLIDQQKYDQFVKEHCTNLF